MPPASENPTTHETAVQLVGELESLKRRGANLLVVGPTVAHDVACSLLLGSDTTEPRRRLFVLADGSNRPPAGGAHPAEAVFRYAHEDRSAVTRPDSSMASQSSLQSTALPWIDSPHDSNPVEPVDDSLGPLCRHVCERIDEIESRASGLEPAELRLCLDSLTSLITGDGMEATFRFLHLLTRKIRSVRGMGHVHWYVEPDDPAIAHFSPLFDAVIELRIEDGGVRQRWTLTDSALETEWLPIG